MSADIIEMFDYVDNFKEVFSVEGVCSTLQIYVDRHLSEIEIIQMNDDNEAIRTLLSTTELRELIYVLNKLQIPAATEK